MKKFTKGFTLIELLVVIAIIGILSSIVLASLGTARSKGKDAAVQEGLSGARAQAELYYASNSKYSGVCAANPAASGLQNIISSVATSSGLTAYGTASTTAGSATVVYCGDSASAWAASAPTSNGFWCVDSTGASKLSSTTASGVACN